MSKLPKLKIIGPFRYEGGEIHDVEQAKDVLFRTNDIPMLIIVEGQSIHSYQELIQLASQEHNKDKEFLEVEELPIILSGG